MSERTIIVLDRWGPPSSFLSPASAAIAKSFIIKVPPPSPSSCLSPSQSVMLRAFCYARQNEQCSILFRQVPLFLVTFTYHARSHCSQFSVCCFCCCCCCCRVSLACRVLVFISHLASIARLRVAFCLLFPNLRRVQRLAAAS
jgi:hypothetical protein